MDEFYDKLTDLDAYASTLESFYLDTQKDLRGTRLTIEKFMTDKLFNHMDKMTQCALSLKSRSNDRMEPETQKLESRSATGLALPTTVVEIPIAVAFGIYTIKYEIDFNYGYEFEAKIKDYRDVEAVMNIAGTLHVTGSHSYGIFDIPEVGIFLEGNVLIGDISSKADLQNVVPLHLTEKIAALEDLNEKNIF